jgi:hypothetical protein
VDQREELIGVEREAIWRLDIDIEEGREKE